ncbi:hypothetical protein YenMTG1_108 [Yersinia phage vB_YenM_TG1]|uniref:Uncharacterized protein n=1 Tax=Yersinia phage vB_YenM_TG1 TaxID=1589265 RepID=A0A0B4ZZG6_9CAUD|nr:membrane protein [Yersinia phage vB_YenM_TG1]AJD81918.1 hypothetical protein YenMTG1_108 [Yersinia phage vB_YenM_TG1]
MKISKKSWHYRLHMFYSNKYSIPKTLCGYFWKTVGYCAFILFTISVALGTAGMLGFPILKSILASLSISLSSIGFIPLSIVVGFIALVIILTVCLGGSFLVFKGFEASKDFIKNKAKYCRKH